MSIQVLWPFLNQVFKNFCWVLEILYIFWILISYQINYLQIFFPFCRLPFYSVNIAFWCKKTFKFKEVQFVYFFFCCLCFWCHIQEIVKQWVFIFIKLLSQSHLIIEQMVKICSIAFQIQDIFYFIRCKIWLWFFFWELKKYLLIQPFLKRHYTVSGSFEESYMIRK